MARIVFGILLEILRKEKKERKHEMTAGASAADPAPAAVPALDVPHDFGRQVAGPGDQELRKIQIRPEHDQRQQQFAEVVQVPFRDA